MRNVEDCAARAVVEGLRSVAGLGGVASLRCVRAFCGSAVARTQPVPWGTSQVRCTVLPGQAAPPRDGGHGSGPLDKTLDPAVWIGLALLRVPRERSLIEVTNRQVAEREVSMAYVGRPKKFDPEAAVERAMEVFWGQGYGATTPQQLADRMQIGKASLYNAFGGKRQLYDLALRRYIDARVHFVGSMLDSPGPAKEVLRRALVFLVETDLERPDRLGCFATNSAVEFGRTDEDVTDRVLDFFGRTEAAFRALIERGQRDGDIRRDLDAAASASMLLSTATGLHVLARVASGPERLLRVVDATLELL